MRELALPVTKAREIRTHGRTNQAWSLWKRVREREREIVLPSTRLKTQMIWRRTEKDLDRAQRTTEMERIPRGALVQVHPNGVETLRTLKADAPDIAHVTHEIKTLRTPLLGFSTYLDIRIKQHIATGLNHFQDWFEL